jgi:hypothetical protein
MFQLMHNLQVPNLKGVTCAACVKKPCPYQHVDVKASSKRVLHGLVNYLEAPRGGGKGPLMKKEVAEQAHKRIKAM